MTHINSITLKSDAFQQSTDKMSVVNSVDVANSPISNNSMFEMFKNYTALTRVTNITSTVTNMAGTFSGCSSLSSTPTLPTSVSDITNSFVNCSSLTTTPSVPSSVTAMSGAFEGCSQLTTAPSVPSAVADLSRAFKGTSMTGFSALSANVTNIAHTFEGTPIVSSPDLSSATGLFDMTASFKDCTSLSTAPSLSSFSHLSGLTSTFEGCSSLTTAPALPSSATSLKATFKNSGLTSAPSLHQGLTDISEVVSGCSSITVAPSVPNTVTNMAGSFKNTAITAAPDLLETPLVNVSSAFENCTSLTGDIHIGSANITSAVNCFAGTTATKNVIIPFVYISNGQETATHAAFNAAGYKEDGSVCGVYLKDDGSIIFSDWSYTENPVGSGDFTLTGYIGSDIDIVVPTV